MAHTEQMEFVRDVRKLYPQFFGPGVSVLEVGSKVVCGSCRQEFKTLDYVGLDMESGPGVTVVSHLLEYNPGQQFDVVVSCEAMEHDKRWKESLLKMVELVKPGGLLLITAAGPDRPEHNSENGYYGNISETDLKDTFRERTMFSKHVIRYDRGKNDIQMWAIKREEQATDKPAPSIPLDPEPEQTKVQEAPKPAKAAPKKRGRRKKATK